MASAIADPIASYCFMIDIEGHTMATFQKVDGLTIEIKTIEHRENTGKGMPVLKKLPGMVTFTDIVLSRGKIIDPDFWHWIKKIQDGQIETARCSGSITLFDYALGPVQVFNFKNGWPSKVSLGSLQAGGNDVLLETLTITHEGLELEG